jgi:uncharacterized protein with HEPN domain
MERDNQYKKDIIDAIHKIQNSTSDLSFVDFINDVDTYDACVRRLEIIGEAAKHLSNEFKSKLPEVPWKEISGFRDKAIHDYASLHAGIVWQTIETDLQELEQALMKK